MGLNDQVQGYKENENKGPSVFKDGLKILRVSGDDPIFFRILPAFNPQDPNPRTSVYPSRYANDELTDWAQVVIMSPLVGHGNRDSGHRKTIVSLKTYNKEARCPLDTLCSYIYDHKSDWGYLVGADGGELNKRSLGRPTRHLICNVVNVLKLDAGVQLGVISPGAAKTMVNPEGGLCFQANPMPTEGDFFSRWVIRDFTDPVNGVAFKYVKPKSNKMFTSGRIEVYIAANGAVRCPISQDLLAQRINLGDFNSFLLPVTEQSIVADLCEVLTGRSPAGTHEYVLLKQVFPQMRIPDPPAEGVYVSSGFGQPPGAVAPQDNIPGMGVQPPTAPYIPTGVPPPPAGTPTQSTGATVLPQPPPAVAVNAAPLPPAPSAPAPALAPATQPLPPPPAPTHSGAIPLPPAPLPPPAPTGTLPNQLTAPPLPSPTVPGDPVPIDPNVFDHGSFLDTLNNVGKKK